MVMMMTMMRSRRREGDKTTTMIEIVDNDVVRGEVDADVVVVGDDDDDGDGGDDDDDDDDDDFDDSDADADAMPMPANTAIATFAHPKLLQPPPPRLLPLAVLGVVVNNGANGVCAGVGVVGVGGYIYFVILYSSLTRLPTQKPEILN